MQTTNDSRLYRASCSLDGLSVGDAFGERFFVHPDLADNLIASRAIPSTPWYYTDDTQMALSIFAILRECGEINQEKLAASFAQRYDSQRGYGAAMHSLLAQIRDGGAWQKLSTSLFNGQGSYGNGAAMRVAPVGAFFADDLELVVTQAQKSAEITHTHPEGIAGAIAVAVAAARACKLEGAIPTTAEFLDQILPYIPDSEVKSKICRARELSHNTPVKSAAAILGNGTYISAQDTVPFAIWCAAKHLDNYEEALWLTVSGLGDRDTTCAIAGGIVALYAGKQSIPAQWLQAREALPSWAFLDKEALHNETVTLWRPVGPKELSLIKDSGYQEFPPRLPEQPIFYPVLNEEYAIQIARNWNAASADTGYIGYVTRFQVRAEFLSRYSIQTVGASMHQEYWIPAADLAEFNRNIVGLIEVVAEFQE
ncbi:ADP-ribosylglycohydrolase family protein [Iningainema tapete]|uniref:ADP-ribosylglycohydrolase family protein n=1 Tax=Iningainema tapete BLCC-T55 TaxID=2748662 RepID=A0A8J6XNA5_9CYAN|nr:ADP-ribosylglycohydrolase family protein [Iningainema tapete]MBD2776367.1 ADP-ribosylglycohydrolase family protein [Iningainema tapete BLCC-T55]